MLERKIWNILIVGTGGQGITTLAQLLQQYLSQLPNVVQITATESRGVAQREGSVMAFIRCVFSDPNITESIPSLAPIPPVQGVHLLIAFEATEFLRNMHYLQPDGIAVVNSIEIPPKSAVSAKKILDPPLKSRLQQIHAIYPQAHIDLQNTSVQLDLIGNQFFNLVQTQINLLEKLPSLLPVLFQSKSFQELIENLKERKTRDV